MSHRPLHDDETFRAGLACAKTITMLLVDRSGDNPKGVKEITAVTDAGLAIAFDAPTSEASRVWPTGMFFKTDSSLASVKQPPNI
jgi:hypothetical protein